MEFNSGILVLGALWFLFNLLSRAGRKNQTPPPPTSLPPTRPRPRTVTLDATQQEGTRLESVLRELQRAMEQGETPGRRPGPQVPQAEELEELESLEVEPEVRSLEEDVRREPRRLVDQDEEAEQIEARRIKAAADRDAPRVKADHVEFDQRIRQEAADKTATRGYTIQQLRHAVVWREILGPPVSMRDE